MSDPCGCFSLPDLSSARTPGVDELNCPCDNRIYIPPLNIHAGLDTIPRQIAGFAEFRNSLLAGIPDKPALAAWRARGKDDFGIMLLEMWAYVCDVLAFYDETIAHELYLRTARRRPSLRKLVGLLGYIPAPAVASFVKLALLAEGRKPVSVPLDTAFRSGAFDGEPPQVFEIDNETVIHPLNNQWQLEKVRPSILDTAPDDSLYLDPKSAGLKEDDIVLVRHVSDDDQTTVCRVDSLSTEEIAGEKYTRVDFDRNTSLSDSTQLTDIKLQVPKQTASPWTLEHIGDDQLPLDAGSPGQLVLDGLYRQIKTGQYIILGKNEEYRWFKVENANEIMMTISGAKTTEVFKNEVLDSTIVTPPVQVPVTRLEFHRDINYAVTEVEWTDAHASQIVVYYGFFAGGTVISPAKSGIDEADSHGLEISGSIETPPEDYLPGSFLLEDKNGDGFEVKGSMGFTTRPPLLGINSGWGQALVSPVGVFGNLVDATRGESVNGEILGSGDGSTANQSFVLKKKPLTYITAPTADDESVVSNTLKVYVNGIQWSESASFYGVSDSDEVYIVRQDDEGNFSVIFGDGERGARIPSGVDNVVAYYRWGAGSASPPSGSITQLAKPVKGLKSVKNPVAAAGGADKEAAEKIRAHAPGSALLLGRAVSIVDMETAAARVPGVEAVQVQWRWHRIKQCALVHIWYIGEDSIQGKIVERLRSISEPTTLFAVEKAHDIIAELVMDVELDTRYLKSEVEANIQTALMGESGMLLPANIGIGKPLLRSRIFETVLSVPGTIAVSGIRMGRKIEGGWGVAEMFSGFFKDPKAGNYYDFEAGRVLINSAQGGETHD
jgi:hypothetical protein